MREAPRESNIKRKCESQIHGRDGALRRPCLSARVIAIRGRRGHVFSVRAGCNGVARTSSLLYRGFLIRKGCDCSACSRLEVGDTAGWKPALQKSHAELFM